MKRQPYRSRDYFLKRYAHRYGISFYELDTSADTSVMFYPSLAKCNKILPLSPFKLALHSAVLPPSSITKERSEVIFQGTLSPDPKDPEAAWEEYQFSCKPGDVYRRPCLISPYHYRLDWLMWFAAFQVRQETPECVFGKGLHASQAY